MPFFGVWQLQNPLKDFQIILHSWLRRRPHPTCKCRDQLVQRGRVCTCMKFSPSGIYFVIFLGPMLIATGRPVEPIIAVNGSNDASWWYSHLYMVWIIKIKLIFSLFLTQKSEKLHYDLWQLRRAITRPPLKICARCLLQTEGFRARPIERCPSNLPLTDVCCHGNQPLLFEHAIIRLMWEIWPHSCTK